MNILLVEDEAKVASFIKQGLEEQGYVVDLATDGQMGLTLFLKGAYDVAVLDVIVPFISGVELCRAIKNNKPSLPVIMLTALGTTEDKVNGFEAGADDYLVKPFEFRELLLRLKALTRRSQREEVVSHVLTVADLTLDLDKKVAHRGNKQIDLTAKEFGLLEYLMRNKGRVVSKIDISEKVWDIDFDTGTNVVEVYINILRKKIDRDFEDKLIHTRIGMGYIFEKA
ncbi:MAG: response regulator transcription factor [Imperialibacter sp.]|uniref:response regulator transcription factor n=1 Tax=Imperialibacter sp. TaxID=2038411 RepID=UPI0030D902EE|tara:strand:+ start:2233 stop:2910 length:678 start_codon:yes stop_codon:yes gene_type:complete